MNCKAFQATPNSGKLYWQCLPLSSNIKFSISRGKTNSILFFRDNYCPNIRFRSCHSQKRNKRERKTRPVMPDFGLTAEGFGCTTLSTLVFFHFFILLLTLSLIKCVVTIINHRNRLFSNPLSENVRNFSDVITLFGAFLLNIKDLVVFNI